MQKNNKNTSTNRKETPEIMLRAVVGEILEILGDPVAIRTKENGGSIQYFVFGMTEEEIRICKAGCDENGKNLRDELINEGALVFRVPEENIISM